MLRFLNACGDSKTSGLSSFFVLLTNRCVHETLLWNAPENSPFLLILAPENFQQSQVPIPVFRRQSLDSLGLTVKGMQWAISSIVGMVAQWTHSLHNVPGGSRKRRKTQANLFVLPAPLPPLGRFSPAWDQPTSPGKLSSESRMGKESCRSLPMGLGVQQRR